MQNLLLMFKQRHIYQALLDNDTLIRKIYENQNLTIVEKLDEAACLQIPRVSHPYLERRLSFQEHEELIDLLKVISGLLDEAEVPYVMGHGTLLGSYLTHVSIN